MLRLFHAWPTASLAMSVKDGKEALGPGPAVFFCDTAEGRRVAQRCSIWAIAREAWTEDSPGGQEPRLSPPMPKRRAGHERRCASFRQSASGGIKNANSAFAGIPL
jgi:hypothetical protein